jgi:hypothetical protein
VFQPSELAISDFYLRLSSYSTLPAGKASYRICVLKNAMLQMIALQEALSTYLLACLNTATPR